MAIKVLLGVESLAKASYCERQDYKPQKGGR